MGIQLPDEVRDVLEFIGIDWPDIDEDELRDTAKEYRDFADELRDTIQKADRACSHITAGRSKGEAVDAFKQRWGKVSGQDMKNLAKAVDVLAGAMDSGATYVTTCKLAIIGNVTASAATVTGGIVGAFFTGGLTALLSAAAVAALKQAVKEAIDLLVSKLVDLAVQKIEGEVMGLLEGLFDGSTTSGGRGRNGKPLPEGSTALGQELWIEFAEFEDAIAELGQEHERFTDKKDRFTGKRQKRSLVSKKDDRFAKFGAAIDKAEDKVEQSAHRMQKELEKNVEGLDKTKRSNDRNEKDTKDDFDRCRRDGDDDDDVPMYLLNADGSVKVLHPDGRLSDVPKDDKSGIWNILEKDGTVWRPKGKGKKGRNPYPVPAGRQGPKVSSRKIPPGSTDLSRATEIARFAKDDYGGTNFAAGRYMAPETGKAIILVGDSRGPHSEKTIGYPLLKHGREENLREIYTEREPCQLSPKCDQWLDLYFRSRNPDLEVTHANSYDQSDKTSKRDKEHLEYMEKLEKRHKAQGRP